MHAMSGTPEPELPEPKTYSNPENIPSTSTWADGVMQNTRNTRPEMLQHITETLPDTWPEGTQTTINMPPVMEQTSQSRCTQEQPNIAKVNVTPWDNNTIEQSNKYSDDMVVDTTDHPIMKDDVKHMSIQAQ
jgi:hypothetical protein